MSSLLPSLDHTHYARWVPAHTRDMFQESGQRQYQTFMADRPLERSTPNSEPTSPERKVQASLQVSSMKSGGSLFSRVYIACQLPGGNLDDFFPSTEPTVSPEVSQLGNLKH
ncbi:hypothetical protein LSAT2_004109 [Lamellibrachia satsuma]|nr:hypothetical protein LSAT2_004109 [Lamellibrachia satsuma]